MFQVYADVLSAASHAPNRLPRSVLEDVADDFAARHVQLKSKFSRCCIKRQRRRKCKSRKLRLGLKLGEGYSGDVYSAVEMKNGGTVALKFVSNLPAFIAEKRALEAVDHPNVIKLRASDDIPEGIPKRLKQRLLVLDYCSNGDLFSVLKQGRLPESIARAYSSQLFKAIAACHRAQRFHRDIKPENILMANDWSLRLADFGFASGTLVVKDAQSCGTPTYMAPEFFQSSIASDLSSADVWSAGVVTFFLVYGVPPVERATSACWLYKKIQAGEWKDFWRAHDKGVSFSVSQASKEFLQKLLQPAASQRPSADTVLSDPWFDHP
eukprot:CAMPEP_0185744836 /NCGR_PEP_ID=MMETSP1174-20130828/3057_1 /TAXON_ID=35687 /ORGANISM="Dictyocha speculum, Strain CCMP1381" /LENGTH=323 /DNA_ID=CAMNT_0028418489 /DNA_START=33 /DNA_END=1000 /DNA_ORIENTATION=-